MRSHIRALLITPVVLLIALAVGAAQEAGSDGGPKPGASGGDALKPLAPHKVLMYWHDQTLSQLNLALSKKDEEKVERNAWLLAELAAINQRHRDDARFREFAAKVRENAVSLAEAAKAKDFERGKGLAKTIRDTCDACHEVYEE